MKNILLSFVALVGLFTLAGCEKVNKGEYK